LRLVEATARSRAPATACQARPSLSDDIGAWVEARASDAARAAALSLAWAEGRASDAAHAARGSKRGAFELARAQQEQQAKQQEQTRQERLGYYKQQVQMEAAAVAARHDGGFWRKLGARRHGGVA
jgi:hypothetical protein